MYDAHYDLLTYIIMKQKDLGFIKKICEKLYRDDNIKGGIINLYYMPEELMKNELGINKIDPIYDLKYAKEIIELMDLLPNPDNFLFGIEGSSYIDINDLDELYSLGLRSINPIYNEDNQYGGGAGGDENKGLTPIGEMFIRKAVELKIGIDISHANRKTTMDILNLIETLKSQGYEANVYASHSNARDLCDSARNLSVEEIQMLKKVDGTIGIVCRKTFCGKYSEEQVENDTVDYIEDFNKQLSYIIELMGIDNVVIASDDMNYHPDDFLSKKNAIFEIENINNQLMEVLLSFGYSKEIINKLLVTNFEEKLLKKQKNFML